MTSLTVPAGDLADAAEWASRACPAKSTMPVLLGLMIDATDGDPTISGFDFYTGATVAVPSAAVKNWGRVLVPGRLLASIAKTIKRTEDVRLDDATGALVVTAGRARWEIPTIPTDEYPKLPDAGTPAGTVEAGALRQAIRRVLPAASREKDGLANLAAVQISSDGDSLTIAATDRFRLAFSTIPWVPATGEALDLLVPGDLLDVAAKIGDDSDTLTISTGSDANLIGLAVAGQLTTGRVVDEEYPKWRALVPTPGDRWAKVAVAELHGAVKQVSPALDGKAPLLTITTSDDAVVVAVAGPSRAGEAEVSAETSGEPIQVCFNAGFLEAALKGVSADAVTAYFGVSNTRPTLWLGDDPDQYQHLLMPVRNPGGNAA